MVSRTKMISRVLPALKTAYEARFKKPLSNGVINGYDMMRMVGASLQSLTDEKHALTREALNEKLTHLTFDGIATRYEFTPEWHNGPHLAQIPLCTYKDGARLPWSP